MYRITGNHGGQSYLVNQNIPEAELGGLIRSLSQHGTADIYVIYLNDQVIGTFFRR